MIQPELFARLRAAQLRSVREQELLSGRNWILICSCAHVLALIYPAFLLLHLMVLGTHHGWRVQNPTLNLTVMTVSGLALLACWWWAKYAPYRAALTAFVVFFLIHGVHALADPRQFAVAALFKVFVVAGLLHAVVVAHGRRRAQ